MGEYFHVGIDLGPPSQPLSPGRAIELTGIPLSGIQTMLFAQMLPDGFAIHGVNYLRTPARTVDAQQMRTIELAVELVRRVAFAELPSRFCSVFGCESMDEARHFRDTYRREGAIWRVEGELAHRGDMTWLNYQDRLGDLFELAVNYWAGSLSTKPHWEVLLRPPVRVLELVEPAAGSESGDKK